jgi:hypothetical protein
MRTKTIVLLGLVLGGCYLSHEPEVASTCAEPGPGHCLLHRPCWCSVDDAGLGWCSACRENCVGLCECRRIGGGLANDPEACALSDD